MALGGCWYVSFPLEQYNEDVITIASERGLTIIDAQYQGANMQMRNAPILTLKEVKPSPKK